MYFNVYHPLHSYSPLHHKANSPDCLNQCSNNLSHFLHIILLSFIFAKAHSFVTLSIEFVPSLFHHISIVSKIHLSAFFIVQILYLYNIIMTVFLWNHIKLWCYSVSIKTKTLNNWTKYINTQKLIRVKIRTAKNNWLSIECEHIDQLHFRMDHFNLHYDFTWQEN